MGADVKWSSYTISHLWFICGVICTSQYYFLAGRGDILKSYHCEVARQPAETPESYCSCTENTLYNHIFALHTLYECQ